MTLHYECDFCGRNGPNNDNYREIEATKPVTKISSDKGHLCQQCLTEIFE